MGAFSHSLFQHLDVVLIEYTQNNRVKKRDEFVMMWGRKHPSRRIAYIHAHIRAHVRIYAYTTFTSL